MLKTTAVLAVLGLAVSAQAVTVTSTAGNLVPTGPGIKLIDFDSGLQGASLSGNFILGSGSITNVRAAPAGKSATDVYLSVPETLTSTPLTAVLGLAGFTNPSAVRQVSFYWGSIDTFNTVQLLDVNLVPFFTLAGPAVPGAGNFGDQSSPLSNRRVTFDLLPGQSLGGLAFTSSNFAFEVDDVAVLVPEPATWAMLIAGFGMVGFAARRRRAATALA